MNRSGLTLFIGGLVLFASCSGVDLAQQEATTKIDSMVQSRVHLKQVEFRRRNDSIIRALALKRADSILHNDPIGNTNEQ